MTSSSLPMVCLNIERDRHFDRILPFLEEQNPEIVLVQEVLYKDLAFLEKMLGMTSIFTPLATWYRDEIDSQFGIATFSKLPIIGHNSIYYKGDPEKLPIAMSGEGGKIPRALLITEVAKEEVHYCFVNTHFTWTPDGKPNEAQYKDLAVLLQALQTIPGFILCGDFNAPRGTAIFDTLASKYQDNIPLEVKTTIDKNLHKAGNLNFVVDGLFTTPQYRAEDLKIIDNLSDHCAITAKIRKVKK